MLLFLLSLLVNIIIIIIFNSRYQKLVKEVWDGMAIVNRNKAVVQQNWIQMVQQNWNAVK